LRGFCLHSSVHTESRICYQQRGGT
jgi:hypothetical protein